MTGPEAAFEGKSGFFAQTGCEPDTDRFAADLWKQAPARVCLKAFPVQYLVQPAVEAGVQIHARGVAPAHIECIKVRANSELIRGTAADRTRWAPRTRETADHSLPFCLAVPILHGSMRIDHFDDATLRDTLVGGSTEDVGAHLEGMRGLVDAGSVRAAIEAIVHSTPQ